MKKVEALIQLTEVDEVQGGLTKIGIEVMTVSEVKTFGKHGPVEYYRGRRYEPPFLTEAKLELMVPDDMADSAVAIIRDASHADEPWDTRISVSSLDDLARSRVGKKGMAAA
jgi:nitrogen regulatory protein P-II 1